MQLFSTPVICVIIVAFFISFASCRDISWYMPQGNGLLTNAWLANASKEFAGNKPIATGVYLCCGAFSIDDNGALTRRTDDQIRMDISGLSAAGLKVHYVFGISMVSILQQSWKSSGALQAMSSVAEVLGFDGYICDYEPETQYTTKHAELYADFLYALSLSMHAKKKQSGFCSAGWGILDYWSIYNTSGVDIATSMTPTYNWLGNGEPLFQFVVAELAKGAMPRQSVGAGIGTMLAPGYKPEWDYNWTQPTLQIFTTFLTSDAVNISRMDFWRADIDPNWGPEATAPFVFLAAAAFLSG